MHKKKSSTLTGLTWCTNKAVAVYFPLGVAVFAFFGIALQVTCDETLTTVVFTFNETKSI